MDFFLSCRGKFDEKHFLFRGCQLASVIRVQVKLQLAIRIIIGDADRCSNIQTGEPIFFVDGFDGNRIRFIPFDLAKFLLYEVPSSVIGVSRKQEISLFFKVIPPVDTPTVFVVVQPEPNAVKFVGRFAFTIGYPIIRRDHKLHEPSLMIPSRVKDFRPKPPAIVVAFFDGERPDPHDSLPGLHVIRLSCT
jgi:hypothetical protein